MSKVAAVGSINTDFVARCKRFPSPGETVVGESFAIYGGGKGANQAIAASRLGARVEFFGAVGQDANSLQRLADLQSAGVGTHHIAQVSGYGGVAVIQVESGSGQNSITLVPGANAEVQPHTVERDLSGYCVTGDVISLQLEIPLETVGAALTVGRRVGARTVLNAAPFDPRAADMLELVDALIVNEIEAGQFLGSGPITLENAQYAARALRKLGVREAVVITLGSQGAFLADGSVEEHVPAQPVTVVDTTAAGDAFCGAFCAWLSKGFAAPEAVNIATIAGSLAVQRHGAQPSLPALAELKNALGPIAN